MDQIAYYTENVLGHRGGGPCLYAFVKMPLAQAQHLEAINNQIEELKSLRATAEEEGLPRERGHLKAALDDFYKEKQSLINRYAADRANATLAWGEPGLAQAGRYITSAQLADLLLARKLGFKNPYKRAAERREDEVRPLNAQRVG